MKTELNIEKMREQFEAWVDVNLGLSTRRTPSGAYQSFGVYSAWEAWQGSRTALAVEWPDRHDYTNPDIAGAAILDCRTAFGKAVKVIV